MLALVPRILMRTHVPPRPTIEASGLDVRNVVGNQIVAPVSYTHLDVYKRQLEALPVRSENVDDVLSLLNTIKQDLVIGR